MSRVARSMVGRPAASAAARARLPALWPWRTIHNLAGHLCLTRETKHEPWAGFLKKPFRDEPGAKVFGGREEVGLHPHRLGAEDIDLPVVHEQGLGAAHTKAFERPIIDRRI